MTYYVCLPRLRRGVLPFRDLWQHTHPLNTPPMALPPVGSKVTVRAFFTGDADVAGWSSHRRRCQWLAVEMLSTSARQ